MALSERVEGVSYTPEAVQELRQKILIPLRDAALGQDRFDYAVGLSHVIAYMADYADVLASEISDARPDHSEGSS